MHPCSVAVTGGSVVVASAVSSNITVSTALPCAIDTSATTSSPGGSSSGLSSHNNAKKLFIVKFKTSQNSGKFGGEHKFA